MENKKTLYIVLGVVAIILLCMLCSCVIFAFGFMSQNSIDLSQVDNPTSEVEVENNNTQTPNADETAKFVELMKAYAKGSDDLGVTWDGAEAKCSTDVAYDELMGRDIAKEDVASMYAEVDRIINQEWDCYREIYVKENTWDKEQLNAISKIDCAKTDYQDDCELFIKEQQNVVDIEKELIDLNDLDNQSWLDVNVCYIDALGRYYDDANGLDTANNECDAKYPSKTEEIDVIEAKFDASITITEDLARKY